MLKQQVTDRVREEGWGGVRNPRKRNFLLCKHTFHIPCILLHLRLVLIHWRAQDCLGAQVLPPAPFTGVLSRTKHSFLPCHCVSCLHLPFGSSLPPLKQLPLLLSMSYAHFLTSRLPRLFSDGEQEDQRYENSTCSSRACACKKGFIFVTCLQNLCPGEPVHIKKKKKKKRKQSKIRRVKATVLFLVHSSARTVVTPETCTFSHSLSVLHHFCGELLHLCVSVSDVRSIRADHYLPARRVSASTTYWTRCRVILRKQWAADKHTGNREGVLVNVQEGQWDGGKCGNTKGRWLVWRHRLPNGVTFSAWLQLHEGVRGCPFPCRLTCTQLHTNKHT